MAKLEPMRMDIDSFEILNSLFGGFKSSIYEAIKNNASYETPSQYKFVMDSITIAVSKDILVGDNGTKFGNVFNINIEFPYNEETFNQGYSLNKAIYLNSSNLSTSYVNNYMFTSDTIKCLKWIFKNINKNINNIHPSFFDINNSINNNRCLHNAIRKQKLMNIDG